VIQADGEPPKIVAVGQMIGGYRIDSVRKESVTVSSNGWEVELALQGGTADVAVESLNRGNQRGRQDMEAFVRAMQERLGGNARIVIEGGQAIMVLPDGTRRAIQLPGSTGRGARSTSTRIPPDHTPMEDDDIGTSEGGY